MSCGRTQEFLAKHGVEATTVVDAKKSTIGRSDLAAFLAGVDDIYAARGKQTQHIDLAGHGRADIAAIEQAILGPTGNLRAPALLLGRTLIVGFDDEMYRQLVLKGQASRG